MRPCSMCRDPRDAMPTLCDDGAERWLCAACSTGVPQFLGQELQGTEHAGDALHVPFEQVQCAIYMRTTFEEMHEFHSMCRFELHAQWGRIEPVLIAHNYLQFHALIDFSDSNPFDCYYLLLMCRKHGVPLVVADPAILPYGADLTGIRLIVPAPRSRASA